MLLVYIKFGSLGFNIAAVLVVIGLAFLFSRLQMITPSSEYNSRCRSAYFFLASKIDHCPTTTALATIEGAVDAMYDDLISKADNELVRCLCGQLRSMIANRKAKLKNLSTV